MPWHVGDRPIALDRIDNGRGNALDRNRPGRLRPAPAALERLVREEVGSNGFVFKESRPGFYDEEYGKKFYFLIFERPLPNSTPKTQG